MDSEGHITELNNFYESSGLSNSELSALTTMVASIARDHGVVADETEYYVSNDRQDMAVICGVKSNNINTLSDMYIQLATTIAIDERC